MDQISAAYGQAQLEVLADFFRRTTNAGRDATDKLAGSAYHESVTDLQDVLKTYVDHAGGAGSGRPRASRRPDDRLRRDEYVWRPTG